MAQLNVRRLYAPETTLTQEQIDAFNDDIETFLNEIGITDDNINDVQIDGDAKFIDGTVTAITINNNAITTAKLADLAVTEAKVADGAVSTVKILDGAVTNDKIAPESITTAKLDDAVINNIDIAPSYAVSGALAANYTSMTDPANLEDITNGSVTITTSGKPVIIGLTADEATAGQFRIYRNAGEVNNQVSFGITIYRDGTKLTTVAQTVSARPFFTTGGSSAGELAITDLYIPNCGMFFVDTDAEAGEHTYTIKLRRASGVSATKQATGLTLNGKLYAFETQ